MSAPVTTPAPVHVPRSELERILDVQRKAFNLEGPPTAEVRRNRIDRLLLALLERADDIAEALGADYGQRPEALTKSFELLAWLPDANDIRENLEEWMKPTPLQTPEGQTGFIQNRPLGVVGVIGAWNFPVLLSFQPAVAALAAGNRVMVKFPDLHVRTGKVVAEAVAKHFDESEIAVVLGDVQTAQDFSSLQLDHIIFTGSPAIGRMVAEAAGRNLVPVTLELGGKNPVVVAEDADLGLAAHRIAGTRLLNGGQICLCPDYVFAPRSKADDFIAALQDEMTELFPSYYDSPAAVSIVNERNYQRVTGLIDDAVAQGADRILPVPDTADGSAPTQSRLIPPTILTGVPEAANISSEEIFGPVIPVYVYDDIDEVITYVQDRPSPLGAYWYGGDGADFQRFLEKTTSGGVTRNDGISHAFAEGAPFGGVGNSGTGAYHGKVGFDACSHRRPVLSNDAELGISDGMAGVAVGSDQVAAMVDQGVAAALADVRSRV
ncbi:MULTISPECIES: aldehyde dehydrogenase family protein [Gordonia]|uniref:aldehyde dehydrogenase family protein n=1 Tax=Gordonia TaxID=2053 RepID=UPI003263B6D0